MQTYERTQPSLSLLQPEGPKGQALVGGMLNDAKERVDQHYKNNTATDTLLRFVSFYIL